MTLFNYNILNITIISPPEPEALNIGQPMAKQKGVAVHPASTNPVHMHNKTPRQSVGFVCREVSALSINPLYSPAG